MKDFDLKPGDIIYGPDRQLNEEARKLGLTYGQYQAMRMKGE